MGSLAAFTAVLAAQASEGTIRASLTASYAVRLEISPVRIHLAPPRIKYVILHLNVTSVGSNSRVFPEACGGCIFASSRRDDFSTILCRFGSSSLKAHFRWYEHL